VRLVAPGRLPTGERAQHGFLTVGHDYIVLAIMVVPTRGVSFLLLDDRTARPGWHSADKFDLVSTEVPPNWRISVGTAGIAGAIEIAPEPWLEVGFYEDYWSDEPERARLAEETFLRELDVILGGDATASS
jgi:hypothetical protein